MRHIIIGGDGFVGRHLAADLAGLGEDVVVLDVVRSDLEHYRRVPFRHFDITDLKALAGLELGRDDVVYNLAARMLSPIPLRARRRDFFWPVNATGVDDLLGRMAETECRRLVQFTTDMVYGHAVTVPQTEEHPRRPLGPYGASKVAAEDSCQRYRAQGFRISVFRPRLIIGPGRLGILTKLFRLVDLGLPVPMIGTGRNPYQFISVFDCASAAAAAWKADCPNSDYNLGSDDPPSVRALLARLIQEAGSRSVLLPTPAPLVKLALGALDRLNLPLMDPEQYLIADEMCVLDTSKARRELGWRPLHRDDDMLLAAYREYRAGLERPRAGGPAAASAERA